MTAGQGTLAAEVRSALALVIDPELGENVVDLGLIYAIAVEDGVARVEMTTTTPGCPATVFLKEAVQAAAWGVPGIHYAEVKLTYEPKWSPNMMSEVARQNLSNR
jgi:metal-sulfur cluster biosynthetic enzyme